MSAENGSAIDRAWRVFATGLCFGVFGLGGLLLRVLIFPPLTLLISDRRKRAEKARACIRFCFGVFIELMRVVGVLRYEIIGVEKLKRRGLLVLANHPTLIDVVFLGSLIDHAVCIVKAPLRRNPFTRGPVLAASYICNDTPDGVIEDCRESLAMGGNLLIFPEGTRTREDGIIRLRRGASQIAIRCQRDITPVIISCVPRSLTKYEPWYRVPVRPMQFRIEIKDDLPIAPFLVQGAPESLSARQLTNFLTGYFMTEANGVA